MRIHHLNTGTMCPIGRRLVNGTGSIFQRARMVCHCLLAETGDGLALVDTGIGLDDIASPMRLGRKWVRQCKPRLDPAETAVEQVKALGFSPDDVRHVLLTHLDRDHAGGVPDFPGRRCMSTAPSTTWRSQAASRRPRDATLPANGSTGRIGISTAMMARPGSALRVCARSVTARLMC